MEVGQTAGILRNSNVLSHKSSETLSLASASLPQRLDITASPAHALSLTGSPGGEGLQPSYHLVLLYAYLVFLSLSYYSVEEDPAIQSKLFCDNFFPCNGKLLVLNLTGICY